MVFHTGSLRALLEMGVFHALPVDGTGLTAVALAQALQVDRQLIGEYTEESDLPAKNHNLTCVFSVIYLDPQVQDLFKLIVDEYLPAGVKFHNFFRSEGLQDPVEAKNCPYTFAHCTGGKDMWDYIAQYPDRFRVFNNALYAQSTSATWPVTLYPFNKVLSSLPTSENAPLVVDVGGGKGQALRVIRKLSGDVKGRFILQDRPEVLDDITHELPGIEKQPYDIFCPQTISGARTYFIRRVLHDWPEACIRSLKNLASAITNENVQRIVISEKILPAKGVDAVSTWINLADMTLTGAERTMKQWESMLAAAGLCISEVYTVSGATDAAIEAVLK
ncbi:O-methyltransferase, family 2 [Aspergillus terreus]|uniref:O-methyltransferase, family 2 n=1 Tax=Aspergillus terreus TaxID=33178 RepID=A0A5M3ZD00_ASPTE|nr:hypothetical protein ATETN484_0012009700 [Aspergillus terreus]GFF19341.1 O-methyltransferase, family 2 [Aspergillus terreus]